MLLNLADKIRQDRFCPEVIVGISRGGWPPARVISDLLGNPELANVRVEFYLGVAETKEKPIITQPVSVPVKDLNILILDDVADTGKSLQLVREHVIEQGAKTVKTATIYYKPWSVIVPDYYERETRKWVVFPWERRETVKFLLRECRRKGIQIDVAKKKLISGGMKRDLLERFLNELAKEGEDEGSQNL
jgi:hypoxanthine phosphoribosyltransferase